MTDAELTEAAIELMPCPVCGASPRQGCRIVGGPRAGQPYHGKAHGSRRTPLSDAYEAGVQAGRLAVLREIQDRRAMEAVARAQASGAR